MPGDPVRRGGDKLMFVLDAGAARRLLLLPVTLVVVVIVAACTPGAQATAVPASASASAAAGPINLDGTSWRMSDYLSPDGALYTVPGAVMPLAEFKDGMMTGNAGCNTFSATYAIQGDSITLGPVVSTKMACAEPMQTVENAYLAALAVIDKVAILDNGKLQLWDSQGKTTLAFIKAS
jgi:heat shock protein HslJ